MGYSQEYSEYSQPLFFWDCFRLALDHPEFICQEHCEEAGKLNAELSCHNQSLTSIRETYVKTFLSCCLFFSTNNFFNPVSWFQPSWAEVQKSHRWVRSYGFLENALSEGVAAIWVNIIVDNRESKQENSFLNALIVRKASVEAQDGSQVHVVVNAQVWEFLVPCDNLAGLVFYFVWRGRNWAASSSEARLQWEGVLWAPWWWVQACIAGRLNSHWILPQQ